MIVITAGTTMAELHAQLNQWDLLLNASLAPDGWHIMISDEGYKHTGGASGGYLPDVLQNAISSYFATRRRALVAAGVVAE